MTYVLTRVYSNGDHKSVHVEESEVAIRWVEYNTAYRPGTALIVCGYLLRDTGYPMAQQQARELLNRGQA